MTSTNTTSKPPLLKRVLHENAAFSVLSGAVFAIMGAARDEWLGVDRWILIAVGISLVGYAGFLLWGTASMDRIRAVGATAVAGDIGWIIGTLVLVAATDYLTSTGEIVALLICIPVGLFAIGQSVGLRQLDAVEGASLAAA